MLLTAPDAREPGSLLEYSSVRVAPGAMDKLGVVRVYAHRPALDCKDQPAPGSTFASLQTKVLDGMSKLMRGTVHVRVPVFRSVRVP